MPSLGFVPKGHSPVKKFHGRLLLAGELGGSGSAL